MWTKAHWISVCLSLSLFLIAVPRAGHAGDVVGATAGQLNVSAAGSAAYSIPITVPTGTAGMQPKLSLEYNSSAGPGPLGVGWSVGGLSAITRCPRTLFQDDEIKGVDYGSEDRFCLNGARLVGYRGIYGANGTAYRTEYEEFSAIVSYGSVGGGPQKLKVWRKSGEILEFGFTSDSRIEVPGSSTVRLWALNRITDSNGNYIDFSYIEDNANGEFRIDRIDFTGNTAAGLSPYNAVEFLYETRPDPAIGYQAGAISKSRHRLTNVMVYYNSTLEFRDYGFTYETGASGRSRLASVKECAAYICFPATTFDWSDDGAEGFTDLAGNIASGFAERAPVASGDFDGDGMTDLYWMRVDQNGRSTGYHFDTVWLSKGNGNFSKIGLGSGSGITGSAYSGHRVGATGDFNGDGLTDLYLFRARDSQPTLAKGNTDDHVWLAEGDGTFEEIALGPNEGITGSEYYNYGVKATGDFNGDGLTDIYWFRDDGKGRSTGNATDYVWLARETDDTFEKVNLGTNSGITGSAYSGHRVGATGDFNGDGLTDLYVFRARDSLPTLAKGNTNDHIWLASGDGTFDEVALGASSGITGSGYYNYSVAGTGDFNGDGLTDIYWWRDDGNGRSTGNATDYVWLARGDGTFEEVSLGTGSGVTGSTYSGHRVGAAGDFNGDGLTDLYVFRARDSQPTLAKGNTNDHIWLASGDGTFDEVALGASSGITGSQYYNYGVSATGDFNGDGLADIFWIHDDGYGRLASSRDYETWHSSRSAPDLLTSIENGLGLRSDITYLPLTSGTVYNKGTAGNYPLMNIRPSIYVVRRLLADDGLGGQSSNTYKYGALRIHLKGRGSLGFNRRWIWDDATGIKTQFEYSYDYANHKEGLLLWSKTTAPGGTVLSHETRTWEVDILSSVAGTGTRCFRYSPQSVVTKRDLNGALISTVTEETEFDAYGNPTEIVQTTQDGADTYVKTTTNVYSNSQQKWHLGRLTSATVTHERTGQPDLVRTSEFVYDSDTGQLTREIIQPGNALRHTKIYSHNDFGGVVSVRETWASTGSDGIGPTSRTTTYDYDSKGRWLIKETNPLGHRELMTQNARHGLLNKHTGPNDLITDHDYNSFGWMVRVTSTDGVVTEHDREACGGGCPANGAYYITTETDGAPPSTVYKDKLHRELRVETMALDGQLVFVDTQYDTKGRVSAKSEPYFDGDTPIWTEVEYDLLGRPTLTTNPDGSTQSVVYNGLEQVSTNELGQTKTVLKNALGEVVEVEDDLGNTVAYTYDAIGQLVETEDSEGNVTTAAYDIRGNKIAMSDPDKGDWTYRYNALGLLVEQTDAKGQTTRFTYDVLGRALTRIDDADAPNPIDRTTSWTYDVGNKAVGKLVEETLPGHTATYSYDNLGRPASTEREIDLVTYTSSTSYDTFGRVDETTYPSGVKVRNVYNLDGHLEAVTDSSGAVEYWRALEQDARGNIERFRLGNGVESTRQHDPLTGRLESVLSVDGGTTYQDFVYDFDDFGNLTAREDLRQGYIETFAYDDLNRLTSVSTLGGGGQQNVTLTYDDLGNIASKSDIGAYTYEQAHPGCSSGHAGPHAVTTVSGAKNATYCYDLNGNMTSGDGRAVIYSAYDKPVEILKGLYTTYFRYGPDRARFEKTDVGPSGTTVTTYIGSAFYELETGPSGTKEKHYIAGVAVLIDDGSNDEVHYLLRDHLGSVETITDEAGAVVERTSFDAWGKRRAEDWTALSNPQAYQSATTPRGFTGHEMLDGVGLVHMNGRVYEPELGRFLSADPVVQDATNTQALNRYSYVLNNPLSYTDPSGFFFKSIAKGFKNFVSGVYNGVTSALKATFGKLLVKVPFLNLAGQIVACSNPAAAFTCPAYAVASTLAVGGSLGDAVLAGAIAYASVATFGTPHAEGFLASQGFTEGARIGAQAGFSFSATLARGGSAREGIVSAAAGATSGVIGSGLGDNALSSAARIATGAVIGGIAAEAAGGSFANGAATGAFAALFGEIVKEYYSSQTAEQDPNGYGTGQGQPGSGKVLLDANGNPVISSEITTAFVEGDFVVSSPFGQTPMRYHFGVDLVPLNPNGTVCQDCWALSGSDGVVVFASVATGFGPYTLVVRTPLGNQAIYGHMNGFAPGIARGAQVSAGQRVGVIGNQGRSTGTHLHVEIRQGTQLFRGARLQPPIYHNSQMVR